MFTRFLASAVVCAAALTIGVVPRVAFAQQVSQATVPLIVEGNRPFIHVTFRKADGSTRNARFLLDTGGGGFLIAEPLAREIGLTLGDSVREGGQVLARVRGTVAAFVGDMPLALDSQRVIAVLGTASILPPAVQGGAEGMLPGHVMARYHAVFDYPGAKFTLARPGALVPRGPEMPMPVHSRSGFPRTEIVVAGTTYGLLLDTGAAFTMVSDALLKSFGERNPAWPRHQGAYGEAKLLAGQTLETMFVPAGQWGPFQLGEFGITSQREGTFERYMSSMMTSPIVGALAGNVLRQFRLELDYAGQRLYVTAR